jgi:quinol monooxygenase YgiN
MAEQSSQAAGETATTEPIRYRPGYTSANIHTSRDGTLVVNYAQWQDQPAFEAMLADPALREHRNAVEGLAAARPRLSAVTSVHHRRTPR